jgi:hypothetical protein
MENKSFSHKEVSLPMAGLLVQFIYEARLIGLVDADLLFADLRGALQPHFFITAI